MKLLDFPIEGGSTALAAVVLGLGGAQAAGLETRTVNVTSESRPLTRIDSSRMTNGSDPPGVK